MAHVTPGESAAPAFWEQVNGLVKEKRVTQEWLAARTGIKYQTLRSWISKDLLPRVDDAVRIARELGVTTEYLIEGKHSGVPGEIDRFYMKYRRHSVLLEYLEELTRDQVEDIEALALTLVEKNRDLEAERRARAAG